MLGVLKRRWKPKRASTNPQKLSDACPADEKSRPVHQVHPVCEDKAQLLVFSKRDSNSHAYPLAPNICVEGGRIEFIKLPPDDAADEGGVATSNPPPPQQQPANAAPPKITVTRAQQTSDDEKSDSGKENLDTRVTELEAALEAAKKHELRDRQLLNKLQRQLSRRETGQRDAERERRLRLDTEAKLRDSTSEIVRYRHRLKVLTQEFTRMEETVRSMLGHKGRADQLMQEKAALTIAFETRTQQYQSTISRLNQEICSLRQQLGTLSKTANGSSGANERISALEAENASLLREAAEARRQYERCLDDVANQVVRALVAQKGLHEEVNSLTRKIRELESQNRTLTTLLVQNLHGSGGGDEDTSPSRGQQLVALDGCCSPLKTSAEELALPWQPAGLIKHVNSFESDLVLSPPTGRLAEKRLSADAAEIVEARFSLEDKQRHRLLARLWAELKSAEVTPQRLIEALSAVDAALWVPPRRPMSLNLQLPILQCKTHHQHLQQQQQQLQNQQQQQLQLQQQHQQQLQRSRVRAVTEFAATSKPEEEPGNDSPESGNRDEGYSTMSSDVQGEVTRSSEPSHGLEDLKEASDETDIVPQEAKLFVLEDQSDPDVLYIPLNFALGFNPRNSFPPSKDVLPFQHIMRSFSDSHLCLKITTAPSPCYSLCSPISSSPSILLVDIVDNKSLNPLRRTKATASLLPIEYAEEERPSSWASNADDSDYVQRWLKLDDLRSSYQHQQQQQHAISRDVEYDRAEMEDWSLDLSAEDVRDSDWRKACEPITPGQISLSTLPSIQENNALELEEDSSEILWNNSSYMADKTGGELVALLMDAPEKQPGAAPWPYAAAATQSSSPGDSWSSEDGCHDGLSKRSSAALSDVSESPAVGTDFTRDFYRLVKFESTKSLASTSSRSEKQHQQSTALSTAGRRPSSGDLTRDFSIEAPQVYPEDRPLLDSFESDVSERSSTPDAGQRLQANPAERGLQLEGNYVNFQQLREEMALNELKLRDELKEAKPDDTANLSNLSSLSSPSEDKAAEDLPSPGDSSSPSEKDHSVSSSAMTESSMTSSVSTPDTVVSRIPRRQKAPSSAATAAAAASSSSSSSSTKLPAKLPSSTARLQPASRPAIKSRIPAKMQLLNGNSNIIDGPPHRAVSFHEKATSKEVIDELNRLIRKGDEEREPAEVGDSGLDERCRPTGWVRVQKEVDFTDPKARANLLDVMLASASSDSSPTSSCGGSISSDSTEEHLDYGHLHRIHRFHRQKKASATRAQHAALRCTPTVRPRILGREDFFVRYGDKEREAVASFDFLEEFSGTSSSQTASVEEAEAAPALS